MLLCIFVDQVKRGGFYGKLEEKEGRRKGGNEGGGEEEGGDEGGEGRRGRREGEGMVEGQSLHLTKLFIGGMGK